MKLAVLGGVSSGKNSLANALIGDSLLPVTSLAKSINWKLRNSRTDYAEVYYRDAKHEKRNEPGFRERFEDTLFLESQGVVRVDYHINIRSLQFFDIDVYNRRFINSCYTYIDEDLAGELRECDYIIYVVNTVNPFSSPEREDLLSLNSYGFDNIIFAFNKWDMIAKEERDFFKDFLIETAAEFTSLGEEAMFFLISPEGLKAQRQENRELYQTSGFEGLGQYLTARYLDLENNEKSGASPEQYSPSEQMQTVKTQKNDGGYQAMTQNEQDYQHSGTAQAQDSVASQPFWLPVKDVCYFPDTGMAVIGDVVEGRVECLDKVEIVGLSGKKTTTVKKIACDGSLRDSVSEFERAVLLFEDIGENEVKRGDVICTPGTAVVGRKFQARMDDGYEDAFKTALFEEEPLKFHFGLDDIQGKRYNYISGGLYEIELSEPVVLREGFEFCVVKADEPFAWGTIHKIDALSFEERMVNETSSNKNNINTYRGSEDVQWEDVCKMPNEEMRGYIDEDLEAAGITDYVYSEDIDPCIVRDFLECFDINIPLKEKYVFCRLDWDASDPRDVYGYLLTDTALYWRYSDNLFGISLPTIRRSYVSYSVEEGIRYTEFIIETVFEDSYLLWKIEEGENLSVRRKQFDILQEYVDFYGR